MKVLTLADARENKIAKAYIPTPSGLMFYQKIGSEEGPVHFEVQKKVYQPYSVDTEEGVEEGFKLLNIHNLSKDIMADIIALFRRVYDDHKAEMIVCFGWDKEKKEYTLERAKCATIGPGYLAYRQEVANVGTVHSHGGFGASFSSVDDKHEMNQPGIYMVLGGFAQKVPSMVASITALGRRQLIKVPRLDEVANLDLNRKISDEKYDWWMERTMLLADVKNKKHGWFVLDWKSEIVWWSELERDLGEFKEPGLTIVPYAQLTEVQLKVKEAWTTYRHPSQQPNRTIKVWTPSELAAAQKAKPYTVTKKEAVELMLTFLQKNDLLGLLLDTAIEWCDYEGLQALLDDLTDAYDGCEMALEDYRVDANAPDPHFDESATFEEETEGVEIDDDPTEDAQSELPLEDDPAEVRSEIEAFYDAHGKLPQEEG